MNDYESQIAMLYDEYCDVVYKICYRYLHNNYDAEEGLHETFLLALQKQRELSEHPAPDKWLFATARLISLAMLRRNQKKVNIELNLQDFEFALKSEDFENMIVDEYADKSANFFPLLKNEILMKLSDKERLLYTLRYIEKQDVSQISINLKISYTAATTRLQRLKEKIIKLVKQKKL